MTGSGGPNLMDFEWIAIALGDVAWISLTFVMGLVSRRIAGGISGPLSDVVLRIAESDELQRVRPDRRRYRHREWLD